MLLAIFCVMQTADVVEAKPSLAQRAWDAVLHSYHGFRLLALDARVSARLLWKTMKGNSLTRREQKQVNGWVWPQDKQK